MKQIETFFNSSAFAVVGASKDRNKYGNKVLRCYLQHKKNVYVVHPREEEIEGVDVVRTIAELPSAVNSISIITPPEITEKIVKEAYEKGIKNIWIQPGAESDAAIIFCRGHGINLIAQGPCLLVYLGFND